MDPLQDPILPEKGLNPGSLGWQSDMLTTIPKRQSYKLFAFTFERH